MFGMWWELKIIIMLKSRGELVNLQHDFEATGEIGSIYPRVFAQFV